MYVCMRKSRVSRGGSCYLDFADSPIVLCVTMHSKRRSEVWLEQSRGAGKARVGEAQRERKKDYEGKGRR